jgi:hypothetical protein
MSIHPVQDDHEKDRLHDRRGGLEAERLGAAFHPEALGAGHDPDHQRHERRLDHADVEMRERDGVLEARDVDVGAHAAVEPADEPAAVECGHRAEEGEHRQGQHQRDDARQDQDLDGVAAHGAERVDLLAHLHGADLGGVGAARAARHHDGDDQHADLPEHEDADHVDHVHVGAELAKVEDALLGDDGADQKGDQEHDGHGLPADPVQLVHEGGEPQRARVRQRAHERDAQGPQHVEERHELAPQVVGPAPQPLQKSRQPALRGAALRALQVGALDVLEQAPIVLGQADDLRLAAAVAPIAQQALDQPGAEGVERTHTAHVERHRTRTRRLSVQPVDQELDRAGVGGRPRAGGQQHQPAVDGARAEQGLGAQVAVRLSSCSG